MPCLSTTRTLAPTQVAAHRAQLESEGYWESPEGNGYTLYVHPDGREVQLEEESDGCVSATLHVPMVERHRYYMRTHYWLRRTGFADEWVVTADGVALGAPTDYEHALQAFEAVAPATND
jgi:hypothetical protein